jgi:hypothetical protein
MTLISRYIGPGLQALLAAMVCPPQPLLIEKTTVDPKPAVENDDELDYLTAD